MSKPLIVSAAMAALAVFGAAALTAEQASHREHGAHVHGVGKLDLAQEGPELHLRLDSPAANIIGFEHVPKDEAQRAALEQAVAALKDGAALFAPTPAARCTLAGVSVASALLGSDAGAEGRQAGDYHEHDHEHEHADDAQAHADIAAEYRFLCEHPQELKELRVMVFERFPATERLDVQMVTERGAAGAALTPQGSVLSF